MITAMTGTTADKESTCFEHIHLKVGDILQMQPLGTIDTTHYSVRFMGGLKGQSLMTTLPVIDRQGLWMRPGGEYIFRVLSGRHIYAFVSRLIKARAHPYPYAHFTWPDDIEAKKVRRSPRIGLHLESTAQKADGSEQPVTLLDLSLQGAQVEAGAPLGIAGDRLRIALPLHLAEANRKLTLDAHIRNIAEGEPPRYGLEFEPLADEDQLLLHFFIDYQIAEGPDSGG